ncbi:MAG: iron-containing alcohol dehydrogenase [Lachnospiraceae bacterium]
MAQLMGRKDADKPEDFITALVDLQEACGVADLKMSDYGITPEKFPKMVQNARDTLGVNFLNDPYQLSDEDCLKIYSESYR